MKVDVVVNSMVQQIDRNLKTQALPAAAFRPGEILYGRVMLSSDDRPQIRLDSGALLNAIPSGDVQLFAGATVTLRVSGNTEGQLVMQLLDQELDGLHIAARPPDAGGTPADAGATPQGRAVLRAMEAMRVPIREETVRQALGIMGLFPGMEPEKAVFMAANRIPPTQANADALNALVDGGATTGGELMKLAGMLASQAADTEAAIQTEEYVPADAASMRPAQAGTAAGRAEGAAAQPSVSAEPEGTGPAGSAAGAIAPAAGTPGGAQGAVLHPESDGMLQLQSLIFVSLGLEAADRYAGAVASLQRRGLAEGAAQLALDGAFEGREAFDALLGAFTAAMPEDEAAGTREFLTKLAAGIRTYADASGIAPDARAAAPQQPQGLQRVIAEITDLFARLEADAAGNADELMKTASALRHGAVEHLASEIRDAGAASPAVTRQLNGLQTHVRLLDNISQYSCQQIPVQMNGGSRTVELYVLNRGRNGKKINPENASILIALDTEHMGHLETLISVSKKSIRLRFGVEYPELVGYVDSFTTDIGQAMQEIGYRLSDVRMQVTPKPVTPLSAAGSAEDWDGAQSRLDITL